MRIGSSIPYLPTPVPDRGASARAGNRGATPVQDATGPRGEVTRVPSRGNGGGSGTDSRSYATDNLPPRSRNAVQSYLANGPTLSERLGVELAGVDVRV